MFSVSPFKQSFPSYGPQSPKGKDETKDFILNQKISFGFHHIMKF